ncbi:MAG: hypothetical protein LLG43_04345, partial [Deltaproteobacteria bacterium]|nr:hypothetical protein [Deltaproteobacteria bacterium]
MGKMGSGKGSVLAEIRRMRMETAKASRLRWIEPGGALLRSPAEAPISRDTQKLLLVSFFT